MLPFALRGVGGWFRDGKNETLFDAFFEFVGLDDEGPIPYVRGDIDFGRNGRLFFAGGYIFTENSTSDQFNVMAPKLKRGD